MRHKPIEGQFSLLDELFMEPEVVIPVVSAAKQTVTEKVIKKPKVYKPLQLTENPTVTLHKGGGRIVVTPDDILASLTLTEIRNLDKDHLIWKDPNGKIVSQIRIVPDITVDNMDLAVRPWSLVGSDFDTHPMIRMLRSYGLDVKLSDTLKHWMVKEERRIKREKTPLLLPEFKDTRSLFDKVEAGMVLLCKNDFKVDDTVIFTKGSRYQIVDTARSGTEGVVKVFKQAICPGIKIVLSGPEVFDWTTFHGAMEDTFDYQEKVIYDPKKCVPEMYPELYAYHQKRIIDGKIPVFDHTLVDLPQMAVKRDIADLKLMRMGKTREAAGLVWLWGSKTCAWIGPRNARIFTQRELDALAEKNPAFGKYVVVDKLEDMKKDGLFYLLTYSWVKKQDDPNRKARKQGKSWLQFKYTEKKKDVLNEHKCPHCDSVLVTPYIHKIYSDDFTTGKKHLLSKGSLQWLKEYDTDKGTLYGYVCTNPKCVRTYDNSKCKGAAWYSKKPIKSNGYDVPVRDENGSIVKHPNGKPVIAKTVNYWADINLKAHMKCKEKHIKGRMCTNCGQFDGTWVPPIYRRIKDLCTSVVVDEIHTIKSADSDVGKAVRAFRGKHHLGLTGTLIPNTPSDSYWPLHWNFHGGSAAFPYQGPDGATDFYNQYCEYVTYKRGAGMKDSRKMLPYLKNPIQFWELLAPKMVRRSYEDPLVLYSMAKLGLHIPKMNLHRVASKMHSTQSALMIASINHFEGQFNELVQEADAAHHMVNPAMVLSQMSRMRMAATCPEHFNKVLKKMNLPPIYSGPLGGGKMLDIKNLVAQKTMNGKKVVILSGFVIMRESIATELSQYNPIVFDSQWDDDERAEAFDAFRDDPARQVWIAGTMEIREGVDLSVADTAICTDLLWQPGIQAQAWSRVLTPTKEERVCDVYLLIAENTVDEHIYNTFYAKVAAAEQALDRKAISVRANAVDIKWFVDRILNDRGKILDAIGREAGEELIVIPNSSFLALEERSL